MPLSHPLLQPTARRFGTRAPRVLAALLILLGFTLPALPALAHELGTVQIYAIFHKDGTYRVDIPIDPEHLKPGQEGGPAGETRYGPIEGVTPEVDAKLGRFLRQLVDGMTLRFDGRAVTPRPAIAKAEPAEGPNAIGPSFAPGRTILRLSGPIPGGAHAFVWETSLRLGMVPLILQNEGDESGVWKWLDGSKPSDPFPLAASVVPPPPSRVAWRFLGLGFRSLLPAGLELALFALGLFLPRRGAASIARELGPLAVAMASGLTLALRGTLALSPALLSALLALSVVWVAAENFLARSAPFRRLALVAGFGALHGAALSGSLNALEPPRAEIAVAAAGFGSGLLAAILALLAVFLLASPPRAGHPWYHERVVLPLSALIATFGLYDLAERILL